MHSVAYNICPDPVDACLTSRSPLNSCTTCVISKDGRRSPTWSRWCSSTKRSPTRNSITNDMTWGANVSRTVVKRMFETSPAFRVSGPQEDIHGGRFLTTRNIRAVWSSTRDTPFRTRSPGVWSAPHPQTKTVRQANTSSTTPSVVSLPWEHDLSMTTG